MNPYGTNSGWGTEVMSCHVVSLRLMLRMIAFPGQPLGFIVAGHHPAPHQTLVILTFDKYQIRRSRQRGRDGKWQLVAPSCQSCRMSENLAENPTPSAPSSCDNWNQEKCNTWAFECFPRPACALFNFNSKCRNGTECALLLNVTLRWRTAIFIGTYLKPSTNSITNTHIRTAKDPQRASKAAL